MLCWKAFINADQDSITALADLGTTVQPNGSTYAGIEKLVCKLYQPNTRITKVKELRWLLFRKKQAESERLPPTLAALKEAIKRAHHQCMVWNNDIVPNPELPSPSNYGWKLETGTYQCNICLSDIIHPMSKNNSQKLNIYGMYMLSLTDEWFPIMTPLQPAPDAVLHLVKCGCSRERCSTNRCQCRKAGLPCTDLCSCKDNEEDEPCNNAIEEEEEMGSESSDDEQEVDVDDDDEDDS